MPTGSPVDNIIQAIQFARTRDLQRQQLDQQQAKNEADQAQQDRLLDFHKNEADTKRKQFDMTFKVSKALHEAQLFHDLQDATTAIKSGATVPGDTLTNVRSDKSGTYATHQLPFHDIEGNQVAPVELPDESTEAKSQAEKQRILLAPAAENQLKLEGAKSEDARKLATLNRTSAETIAAGHDTTSTANSIRQANARVAAAHIVHQAGLDIGDTSPFVDDLYNGNTTQESLKKQLPKASPGIFAQLKTTKNGIPLNDKQATYLDSLGGMAHVGALMGQLINLMPDSKTRPEALLKNGTVYNNADVANLRNEIQAQLGGMVRDSNQLNRLNLPEINMGKGLIPDFTLPKTENKKRMEQFYKLYQDKAAKMLQNIPDEQRQAILSRRGLAEVPTPGHKITLNGKMLQYKGTGDTTDVNNYTEVPE